MDIRLSEYLLSHFKEILSDLCGDDKKIQDTNYSEKLMFYIKHRFIMKSDDRILKAFEKWLEIERLIEADRYFRIIVMKSFLPTFDKGLEGYCSLLEVIFGEKHFKFELEDFLSGYPSLVSSGEIVQSYNIYSLIHVYSKYLTDVHKNLYGPVWPENAKNSIDDCLLRLTDRELLVIKKFFGLGCKELRFYEIVNELNISHSRLSQIFEKALRKLAKKIILDDLRCLWFTLQVPIK